MARRVAITGLGVVSGLGLGAEALWEAACAGRCGIDRIDAFDPEGFDAQIGGQVRDFNVKKFVPKTYRKATKVMARDIELAVAAADLAVRDAAMVTPGIEPEGERTYEGPRVGAHIGAGLIAADIDELTAAFAEATDENGNFDIHKWGEEGMTNLTPLWLLKYLPNMLACHVTIIHDAQGPSNTITCGEASSGLSIGESMRVIERGNAEACFCGGAESKMNPMAYYRQILSGRVTTTKNDRPAESLRPFSADADGTTIGEGGGIIVLEALEQAKQRDARRYADVAGIGASHTIYPEGNGLEPHPEGQGIASAIRAALRDAKLEPDAIDAIVPTGTAVPAYDRSEARAFRAVFGDSLSRIPICPAKPFVGNCGAGAGGIEVALAAKMLHHQTLPARVNCDEPIESLDAATADAREADLRHVLVVSTSLGGQNVALILSRAEG